MSACAVAGNRARATKASARMASAFKIFLIKPPLVCCDCSPLLTASVRTATDAVVGAPASTPATDSRPAPPRIDVGLRRGRNHSPRHQGERQNGERVHNFPHTIPPHGVVLFPDGRIAIVLRAFPVQVVTLE